MTCPITLSCYKVVKEKYVDSGTYAFLHEDLHETFLEAKHTIEDDEPSEPTKALRAFYALEYMYFFLLPFKIKSSEHLRWKHNFQEQFERSCEGLDVLIRLCDQTERRIVIDKGTLSLMSRDDAGFATATMNHPLWIISAIKDAAQRLRKHMAGSTSSLAPIGEWLGHALHDGNQNLDQCIRVIQNLNSITIHNPVSPCNTMRKYQA